MITYERAHSILTCDNGILIWKRHYQRPDLIGKRAGHINNGYWRLAIDGNEYYAAQIVWLMTRGVWPTNTVDHEDHNKLNDQPDNLRLATKAQNCANSKMNVRNTSGFKGVSYSAVMAKWQATIRINGVSKHLGFYDDKEIAHKVYIAKAQEAWGAEFVR